MHFLFFSYFKTTKLTINKRLIDNAEANKFSDYLKVVATGANCDADDMISLPSRFREENEDALIDFVFPKKALANPKDESSVKQLGESAILCPTNEQTFTMNKKILV